MAKRQIAIQVYLSPSITADGYLKTNESPVLFVETAVGQAISLSASAVEVVYSAALDDTGLIQTVREVNVAQDILAVYLAKALVDSESIVDQSAYALVKTLLDGALAADAAIQIAMLFEREFGDNTSGFVDVVTRALSILKTSSVNGADALSYFMGKAASDAQMVVDDITRLFQKQAVDTQSQADLHRLTLEKPASDQQTVVDLYDRVVSFFKGFAEAPVVIVDNADFNNGDGLEYSFQKSVSELFATVDAYNRVVSSARAFADGVDGGSDFAAYAFTKSLSSSATEFDALAFAFATGFVSQTAVPSDSLRNSFIKAVSDTQSGTDSFDRVAAFTRVFDSQQTQSDAIQFAIGMALVSTGAIGTDIFNRAVSFVRGYADSLAQPIDAVHATIAKAIQDAQGLSDGHVAGIALSKSETQALIDSYDRVVQYRLTSIADAVILVDDADFNNGDGLEYSFIKQTVDDQLVVDLLGRVAAFNRLLSDNNSLSDNVLFAQALLRGDAQPASDYESHFVSFGRSFGDYQSGATDACAISFARTHGDIQSVSDVFGSVTTFARLYSDAQIVLDHLALNQGLGLSADFVSTGADGDGINESLLNSYTFNANIGGDYQTFAVGKGVSDLQTMIDVFGRVSQFSTVYVESQSSLDLLQSVTFGKNSIDTQLVLDALSTSIGTVRNPADVVITGVDGHGVNEAMLNMYVVNENHGGDHTAITTGKALADTQTQTDSAARDVAFVRATADGVVMVDDADFNNGDGLIYVAGKSVSDAQWIADGLLSISTSKAMADAQVIDDAYTYSANFPRTATEAQGVLDGYQISINLKPSDIQLVSDVVARSVEFVSGIGDGQPLVDLIGIVAGFNRQLVDAAAVQDVASITTGIVAGDSQLLSDSYSRNIAYVRSSTGDQTLVSDASKFVSEKSLFDNQVVSESINQITSSKLNTEAQIVSDALSYSAGFSRSLSDSQLLSDVKSLGIGNRLLDSQLVSDSILYSGGYNRSNSDSATTGDNVVVGLLFSRAPVDRVYANPPPAPVNGWALNHFMVNDSPGGDKFSYVLYRPTPSAVLNSLVVNKNLLNGNLISGLSG